MGIPSQDLTPTIQSLWPHHRSMCRAMVAAGLTPTQLANAYGFSQGQITRIINAPMFRLELARLEEQAEELAVDVRADLKKMAGRAVEILDDRMNKNEMKDGDLFGILDRAGYGKGDGAGFKAGGDINVTQINVGDLSDKELQDDVMNLVEGEWEEKKGE